MALYGQILGVRPSQIPKCAECGRSDDGLGRWVDYEEEGHRWWLCRTCDRPPVKPEMEGQIGLDVGDADALVGELV